MLAALDLVFRGYQLSVLVRVGNLDSASGFNFV